MTVLELISLLNEHDPSMEVLVYNPLGWMRAPHLVVQDFPQDQADGPYAHRNPSVGTTVLVLG